MTEWNTKGADGPFIFFFDYSKNKAPCEGAFAIKLRFYFLLCVSPCTTPL
nr:hypothetical protein K6PH25C3_LOCUS22 [Klebsiella phage vB_Kpn_K6PH25C3]